jgi:hypothetical protein
MQDSVKRSKEVSSRPIFIVLPSNTSLSTGSCWAIQYAPEPLSLLIVTAELILPLCIAPVITVPMTPKNVRFLSLFQTCLLPCYSLRLWLVFGHRALNGDYPVCVRSYCCDFQLSLGLSWMKSTLLVNRKEAPFGNR